MSGMLNVYPRNPVTSRLVRDVARTLTRPNKDAEERLARTAQVFCSLAQPRKHRRTKKRK